jgi:hypothetical protein
VGTQPPPASTIVPSLELLRRPDCWQRIDELTRDGILQPAPRGVDWLKEMTDPPAPVTARQVQHTLFIKGAMAAHELVKRFERVVSNWQDRVYIGIDPEDNNDADLCEMTHWQFPDADDFHAAVEELLDPGAPRRTLNALLYRFPHAARQLAAELTAREARWFQYIPQDQMVLMTDDARDARHYRQIGARRPPCRTVRSHHTVVSRRPAPRRRTITRTGSSSSSDDPDPADNAHPVSRAHEPAIERALLRARAPPPAGPPDVTKPRLSGAPTPTTYSDQL